MYYLRTRPKADAIQFTVDQSALKNGSTVKGSGSGVTDKENVNVQEDEEECVMCGA